MSDSQGPAAVIVLAAGQGTRMRSAQPKVLHGFAGRSLLGHVLAATAELSAERTVVVIGHGRDAVLDHLARVAPQAVAVVQAEQRGTGHAVRIALDAVPESAAPVMVVPGDTPLLRADALADVLAVHRASGAAATLVTSELPDPTGYGRVIRSGDVVDRVVEQTDGTPEELAVLEVASGVYVFDQRLLRTAVARLSTANAQGEQYLPDVVTMLRDGNHIVRAVRRPAAETAGVNDRVQLAAAHRAFNLALLDQHMRAGVTVEDPQTTWVDAGVQLGPDVTLRPGVDAHGATSVATGAVIGPHTSLHDSVVGERSTVERAVCRDVRIGADVTIGPFAYLRPGTVLADGVHVGTYVEVKGSDIGRSSKVPHLSYIGDATIGERSNIGAATVFVNYDGVAKHRTTVGDDVRIGSDTMLVAPVSVGDGAYTGAGTVVTEDVPPGALAVRGAPQRNVQGWVARRRPGTAAALAAHQAQQTSVAHPTSPPESPPEHPSASDPTNEDAEPT